MNRTECRSELNKNKFKYFAVSRVYSISQKHCVSNTKISNRFGPNAEFKFISKN
jgi:hypothetical protein